MVELGHRASDFVLICLLPGGLAVVMMGLNATQALTSCARWSPSSK